jgi:hypothetical protein
VKAGPIAVIVAALPLAPAGASESIYTPIGREACRAPPPEVADDFVRRDLGVQECPAPDGWRLLFVSSDPHSWLELRRGTLVWSAEDAVVYDLPIGLMPNVGGASVVEWRRNAAGEPSALIFRVVAQDRKDAGRSVSRLLVVRLDPPGPCLLGRAATNEAARALADGPGVCPP